MARKLSAQKFKFSQILLFGNSHKRLNTVKEKKKRKTNTKVWQKFKASMLTAERSWYFKEKMGL